MPHQSDQAIRRQALLIGVSHYSEDPGFRELRAPGRDVADLAQVLSAPDIGGFSVTQVTDAGHVKVREEIEEFCAGPDPDDLVLVYLSCHGLLGNRDRLYFVATDTTRKRIAATGVAAAWLMECLDDC